MWRAFIPWSLKNVPQNVNCSRFEFPHSKECDNSVFSERKAIISAYIWIFCVLYVFNKYLLKRIRCTTAMYIVGSLTAKPIKSQAPLHAYIVCASFFSLIGWKVRKPNKNIFHWRRYDCTRFLFIVLKRQCLFPNM